MFTPPCLQQGEPRPTILSAPATITYGTQIPNPIQVSLAGFLNAAASQIDFVTLIRCGSITHHQDVNQRTIRLDIVTRSGNSITPVALPSIAQGGRFIAPPGMYLLFVVTTPRPNTSVRVPSVAAFVQIS